MKHKRRTYNGVSFGPATANILAEVNITLEKAIAYHKRGEITIAKELYDDILVTFPEHGDALHLRGVVESQLGNHSLAVALISKSIQINQNLPAAHSNLGVSLKKLKRFNEAMACYDRAIEIKPDYVDAHHNRGNLLREIGRLNDALVCFDRAIHLKADYADAHNNRGNVLQELGQLEEASASFERAIALRPDFAEAHYNRGNVLRELKRINEALASYDRAIALNSQYAEAYWNKSLALLQIGAYIPGWALYEWRWHTEGHAASLRSFTHILWLGDADLHGKTILLYAEQGLGDTIQFCRYARLVKEQGARVFLEVPEPLVEVLHGFDGVDSLTTAGDAHPHFDFRCPLLSLPLAFKTDLNSIPSTHAYLQSSVELRAFWSQRLGPKKKPRIGLTWSGSKAYKSDHNRSIALSDLLPFLPDNCDYYCLQKDIRDEDKDVLLRSNINFYGDKLTFAHTAALIDLMDVVVSTDTSIPHLSGALGRPTWLMLAFVPDWRWMLDRTDSPWYPSMTLYRQDEGRSWARVLEKIREDLLELSSVKCNSAEPHRDAIQLQVFNYPSPKD